MSPMEFALTAAQSVVDTALYLLAYGGAPIVAIVVAALLAGWAPLRWLRAQATTDGAVRRTLAVAALAFVRPLGRSVLRRELRRLRCPSDVVVYLAVGHGLTVYYLLLMGPLLGKDVLMSHVLGGVLFAGTAVGLARLAGLSTGDAGSTASQGGDGPQASGAGAGLRPSDGDEPRSRDAGSDAGTAWGRAAGEAGRAVALMALGLVLGGVVAAWGLTGHAPAPVEIVDVPWLAQLLNALVAIGASMLLWMWPVENLFVGTYLWKIGLAHAGLVAFFWASTVSPQRLRLYRELWGGKPARRLAAVLGAAALVAGMATALLYRVTPLAINYKLIPAQMW